MPSGASEELYNLAADERLRETDQLNEVEAIDGNRRFNLRQPRSGDA